MLKVFGVIWLMIVVGLVAVYTDLSKSDGAGNTSAYAAMGIFFSIALVLTLAVLVLSRREDRRTGRE